MNKTQIDLVILSPSPEANKLTFSAISTATTIGQLRERISAAVATHPPPARQRLIYRGHALIDVGKTLRDVFSQDIIDSSETLSLHLVLPPEAVAHPVTLPVSTGASSQNQQARPLRHTPQHIHGSSDAAGSLPNQRQGNGPTRIPQEQVGQGNALLQPPLLPQAMVPGHGLGAVPQAQFPPQIQQAFAQLHAVNRQLAVQLAAFGNDTARQGLPPPRAQPQPLPPPSLPHSSLQHFQAQQQQQQTRRAGGQQGILAGPLQNAQQSPSPSSPQPGISPSSNNGNDIVSTPSPILGNPSGNVHENLSHGPNGESWQVVIQSGSMNINPNNGPTDPGGAAPSSPQAGTHTPRLASPSAQSTHARHNIVNNVTAGRVPSPAELGRRPTPNIALMHFQSNLSTIEASMAGGNPIPEAVFEQAQEMLRGLPDLSQETATTLRNRLNDLSRHTRHLRENLHHHLIRAAQERVASQRATQGNESSAVYVLSSPSGPHALLVSPSGWYTTPWQLPTVGAGAHHSFIYHAPTGPTLTQPPINTDISDGQQPHIDASETVQARQQMPQHADPAQVAQVQQQQQANQARDLIRILLPLGGHLWLLIRLFGFVYFFTAGAGWRRTILLGLIASLVFIAQTGIFRPVIHGLWDPIRRHAEGLVPLAAQERPRAAGGTGENADGAGTQLVNREATPQEAAERLLQERERRDLSLVRQSFRRVERAVALFVASLVPGVGERHIAAREAAEAARQAEARASDEQRRRDEEEIRERHEGSSAPDNAGLDGNEQAATEGSSGQEQSHAAQPQLIEV